MVIVLLLDSGVEVVGELLLVGGARAMSGSIVPSALDASERMACGNEVQEIKMKVLAAEDDDHGGVIVEMKEAMDSEVFLSLLRDSIAHWRQLVCGLCFLCFLFSFFF